MGSGRQRTFRDNGPGGVIADAADEIAAGIHNVLEELILGIAAIDDVEAPRLQGRPQLLGFRAAAGGHSRFAGHAFEDVEMDMHLGRAVLRIEPERPGHLGQSGQEAAIDGRQAA